VPRTEQNSVGERVQVVKTPEVKDSQRTTATETETEKTNEGQCQERREAKKRKVHERTTEKI